MSEIESETQLVRSQTPKCFCKYFSNIITSDANPFTSRKQIPCSTAYFLQNSHV